jgi:choline dehydrogenase-like flavoprotein
MPAQQQQVARLMTQGPDAGIDRAEEIARIAPDAPAGFFAQTNLPGLFFVDPSLELEEGDVGLPAASMASGVGGMGIHWATLCPRPRQSERISFLPDGELDAALDQGERLLQVRRPDAAEGLVAALRRVLADEFDDDGFTPVEYLPTASRWEGGELIGSGTDVILGDLEVRMPGFELRTETLARKVLLDGTTAVGAELEDRRTGEVYRVGAQRVVVCADGLRTPQVLFASGIRPAALGRYLNDHLKMATPAALSGEFDPDAYHHVVDSPTPFVPYSDTRPIEGLVVPLALHAVTGQLDLTNPNIRRAAGIAWYGAKELQASDRVEFSISETDYYGMPRMSIRYSFTAKDHETVRMMEDCSRRIASRVGTLLGEPVLAPGGSSLHYQGAARMGPADDETSVCDTYSRVWGIENLVIGGNCVIPTATAANPTLTTVALAWRGATKLIEGLGAHESG